MLGRISFYPAECYLCIVIGNPSIHSATDIDDDIRSACEVLHKGGVILYPTDTVWGIGCDATKSESVKRIFQIKHRRDGKALILLVGDEETLAKHVGEIPPIARELAAVAVKPLTIVYPRGVNLAGELLAEDGSVGIRLTREPFSKELCRSFGKPIVSTSANISADPTPRTFAQISRKIKDSVDYIVRYGRDDTRQHVPSSIISLDDQGRIKILRN